MNKNRITILICVVLAVLTLASFWRVLGSGFVDFDDNFYITGNRWVLAGLTAGSVKWALTAAYQSTWQPMVWLSYMADQQIYGQNPMGFHLTNLLLHLANVLLLFLILMRMTGSVWRSAFVAALFAVHPLRVESVAWIAERKDVLSGLFWMLSMGAYVLYKEKLGWKRYVPICVFMALGLMAKPTLVTLPLAFLALDYWPLGRLNKGRTFGRLAIEKIPLFCLSAASVAAAGFAHVVTSGFAAMDSLPSGVRLANAAFSYVAYLVKMVWPAKLAVFYPHPYGTLPMWQVVGSVVVLVCVTVIVSRSARTRPYLAVGWLWYLVTMLPMIGIIQTGRHGMADRFTYIPLIGIFMAVTWGVAEYGSMGVWGNGRRSSDTPTLPHSHAPILWLPAAIIILACAVGTWQQTGYWKDSVTLFSRAVAVTKDNAIAERNLGMAYINRKQYEKGITHMWAAIRIKPEPRAYNNIGVALVRMGKPEQAIPYYERALELSPDYARARYNLGRLLFTKHLYGEAAECFRKVIDREPDNADAHYYLAFSLAEMRQVDEAITAYRQTVQVDPRYYLAHYNLGVLLNAQGDASAAVEEFEAAIRINPSYVNAHHNLGGAFDSLDRIDEAIAEYEEAIRLNPKLAEAHNNLAIDLYTTGRYAEAWREVGLARKYGMEPHPGFLKALSARASDR